MDAQDKKLLSHLKDLFFRIAKGERNLEKNLDRILQKKLPPPLIELAETFGLMLAHIQAREYELEMVIKELKKAKDQLKKENNKLHKKLKILTIPIDDRKKTQEVKDIQKSIFFKKLKTRRNEKKKEN